MLLPYSLGYVLCYICSKEVAQYNATTFEIVTMAEPTSTESPNASHSNTPPSHVNIRFEIHEASQVITSFHRHLEREMSEAIGLQDLIDQFIIPHPMTEDLFVSKEDLRVRGAAGSDIMSSVRAIWATGDTPVVLVDSVSCSQMQARALAYPNTDHQQAQHEDAVVDASGQEAQNGPQTTAVDRDDIILSWEQESLDELQEQVRKRIGEPTGRHDDEYFRKALAAEAIVAMDEKRDGWLTLSYETPSPIDEPGVSQ